MSNSLLSVKSLKKSFGGLDAVNVKNFELFENQITSLIGPNGAGKTTFFDLITRFQNSDEGSIFFNSVDVSKISTYKLARLGMVRTFQLTRVFDRMSVFENMQFAGSSTSNEGLINSLIQNKSLKNEENKLTEKIDNILEKVNVNNLIFNSNPKISNLGFYNNYEFLIKNINSDATNSSSYKQNENYYVSGLFQYNSSFPLIKRKNNHLNILKLACAI